MGTPTLLSRAIEQYTVGRGSLTAIVVPWEADPGALSMAVTSAAGEGWAIEHTNLGTIRLTDLGGDRTRVSIVAHQPKEGAAERLATLFEAFAKQLQAKFQAGS